MPRYQTQYGFRIRRDKSPGDGYFHYVTAWSRKTAWILVTAYSAEEDEPDGVRSIELVSEREMT